MPKWCHQKTMWQTCSPRRSGNEPHPNERERERRLFGWSSSWLVHRTVLSILLSLTRSPPSHTPRLPNVSSTLSLHRTKDALDLPRTFISRNYTRPSAQNNCILWFWDSFRVLLEWFQCCFVTVVPTLMRQSRPTLFALWEGPGIHQIRNVFRETRELSTWSGY